MKFDLMRAKILRKIKDNEPINVTELSKIVKLSTGNTIYRYLRELESKGLIEMTRGSGRGNPTILKTTKKAQALPNWVFEMGGQ